MNYRDAFLAIRSRVRELQRIPTRGITNAERDEEEALIIALHAMRDWSGSFAPEEMVLDEVPPESLGESK